MIVLVNRKCRQCNTVLCYSSVNKYDAASKPSGNWCLGPSTRALLRGSPRKNCETEYTVYKILQSSAFLAGKLFAMPSIYNAFLHTVTMETAFPCVRSGSFSTMETAYASPSKWTLVLRKPLEPVSSSIITWYRPTGLLRSVFRKER